MWITHPYRLTVECNAPPASAVDSITLDVHVVRFTHPDTGETYGVGYDRDGEVVDTFPGTDYPRQALLWSGGRVVACAGRCDGLGRVPLVDWHAAMLVYNRIGNREEEGPGPEPPPGR